jgi:hypothetical protein
MLPRLRSFSLPSSGWCPNSQSGAAPVFQDFAAKNNRRAYKRHILDSALPTQY